jgi:hypothetical protein
MTAGKNGRRQRDGSQEKMRKRGFPVPYTSVASCVMIIPTVPYHIPEEFLHESPLHLIRAVDRIAVQRQIS